ncbi:MAG: xanthine dehydrogenase family protein, partial [Deltaproteobacteria bacterium]|nr:xanthine dehydrogenase family protein [Deltaproteobacteria bacterium]
RSDGAAKVSGEARYVADLPLMDGELWGATVRSPVPRGTVRELRFDPSFDWSEVTIVRAEDVPDNVVQLLREDQPVLAPGRVNHRYEPVALLACADWGKLAHALAAVEVVVDPLPAVLDVEQALRAETVIWGEDNVMARFLITHGRADVEDSLAGIDRALAACAVVVRDRYRTFQQEQLYLEPQGMLCWWDAQGVHATGSLQCPFYMQKGMARALGLPPERVHVTQAVTGGGFGGKEEFPTSLGVHAALLAKKSGRPVRLLYGRSEDIEVTPKRHPSVIDVAAGCDRDGRLRALQMRVLYDAGAYVTLTPVVLSRGLLHAGGAYRWEDVRIEGIAVATNTPPAGAFRGFGVPQTIWAIERHLDRLARELGRDPGDLRRQNLLAVGATMPTGQVLRGSVGIAACVEKAFAASDYLAKRARGPVTAGRRVRGVGTSMFLHGAGFTGSGERRIRGKVAVDLLPGGELRIRTGSTDIGQGTETVFPQIVADAAGVPLGRVKIAVPCTTHVPDSGPTVASRTVMIVGSIVEQCAAEIGRRVAAERAAGGGSFAEAADRLLARESELSITRQYEQPSWVAWDEEHLKGDAYAAYAWACDVAEVEVDLDTFELSVLDFWSAVDVGKAINPLMCLGQLEGGALQGTGWALSEEVLWDGGKVLNPRMTTYVVPTAQDAPRFHTILVEDPFEHGPGGGAKGIGELPADGAAAAIAAAVEHATGLHLCELPLTPERLFAAWQHPAATPAGATGKPGEGR